MKPIRIKPLKIHFRLDTDRDKVFDFKDCRPFNPFKQHISETTKKRIKHQPIYVSDRPGEEWHVLSKEAKYKAPRARQEMLSALKKFPSILGDFERSEAHTDPYYRFIHKSWKQPVSIAQQARESIYFDKGKIDMDIGIQPVDSLRHLKPFAERYKARQHEMEADIFEPYLEDEELPPEAFEIRYRTDVIKIITKDSLYDKVFITLRDGKRSFSEISNNVFDGDKNKAKSTLSKMVLSGLIKRDASMYTLTRIGKECLSYFDNDKDVRVCRNPYYFGEGCNV